MNKLTPNQKLFFKRLIIFGCIINGVVCIPIFLAAPQNDRGRLLILGMGLLLFSIIGLLAIYFLMRRK
jgi:PGF-CTERM motif